MFTNLIESDSHREEFKRRSAFFLATVTAYALILFAAGVASVYAYDANLEAQTTDLTLLSWVPPITATPASQPRDTQTIRRSAPSNAPVDRNIRVSERTIAVAQTSDPTRVPDNVGIKASPVPPVTGAFRLGNRNVDPPSLGPDNMSGCATCNSAGPVVRIEDKPTKLLKLGSVLISFSPLAGYSVRVRGDS